MRSGVSRAAPDVCEAILERLVPGPTVPEPVCRTLRAASACVIRAWLHAYHRFTITGLENLPRCGPFVMICNHSSHLDGLCLLSALPIASLHRTFPAAAADYFFNSPATGVLSRIVMNALPLHRDAGVRQSLAACRALLRENAGNPGNVLILFPEGTRSTSGALGPFRRGIGDLVAGTEVPVVPCHLEGANKAWPKGTFFPRPRRLTLTIGPPRQYAGAPRDKHVAQQIADELRGDVLALARPKREDVL